MPVPNYTAWLYSINGLAFLVVVDSEAIDRDATVPDDVFQQLKDFGMFGLQIPQEYGTSCFLCTQITALFNVQFSFVLPHSVATMCGYSYLFS